MASSELLTIRYPSGDIEYRAQTRTPSVGELVTYRGDPWLVEHVEETVKGSIVVTLRPPDQSPAIVANRKSRMLADLHERAARLHEDAAKLQAEHADEMTAKDEPAKAERAKRLAVVERELAETHRAQAERRRPSPR